jgi:endonuclease YncB( thermonuclease family)
MKLPALAAALALAASPTLAQSARVIDGDTLKVDGTTYRLWGIDAPEEHQSCADDWPAGRTATEHLPALIGDRHVTCESRTLDRYGRTVAICRADGRDLGADMVADGHAWAFVRYSRDYVMSMKSTRQRRFGREYTATLVSLRGSGVPRTAQRARGQLGQIYGSPDGFHGPSGDKTAIRSS